MFRIAKELDRSDARAGMRAFRDFFSVDNKIEFLTLSSSFIEVHYNI